MSEKTSTLSRVQDFCETVLWEISRFPHDVIVTAEQTADVIVLQATVSDRGSVIGKEGITIKAIQRLLDCMASKHGVKIVLRITEDK